MARKKKSIPEPPPERPVITHWRDWLVSPEPEVEEVLVEEDAPTDDTETPKLKRRRALATGLAASVLLIAGAGGAAVVVQNNSGESSTPSPAAMETPIASSTPTAPEPEFCTRWGETADDGTPDTAAGVIQRLQYAYYVDRDAEGALATYSDAAVVSSEALSAAIEQTPKETEHCLYIEPVDPAAGLYLVDLHVQHPDESVVTYRQSVTVQQINGGNYGIVAVKERKDQ